MHKGHVNERVNLNKLELKCTHRLTSQITFQSYLNSIDYVDNQNYALQICIYIYCEYRVLIHYVHNVTTTIPYKVKCYL